MMRKVVFVLSLVVLVALFSSMAVAQDQPESTAEPMGEMGGPTVMVSPGNDVVIGVADILSGEGLVPLGDDIRRGIELAVEDRPTVTIGGVEFPVKLDVQDDQCSAEGGQAVANRFASDSSIVGVIGPTCSTACRAAGPIFDQAGYTSISTSCTAPDLTAPDIGYASFNRTPPNDSLQGKAAATFIHDELGFTKIATLHDGSIYGESLVGVLTKSFEDLGGEVVFSDAVNVGDTDFRSLLDDMASADPELIYFGGFPAEAARLAEQRQEAGLGDVPFMGADGIYTTEFIRLAGAAAEGVYASAPLPPSTDAIQKLEERYKEEYNTEPTAAYHAYAYDATNMLLDAVEAVGKIDDNGDLVINRAELSEYVRSIGSTTPFKGLTGDLVCDGTGDCATGGIGFFQVVDGAYKTLDFYYGAQ